MMKQTIISSGDTGPGAFISNNHAVATGLLKSEFSDVQLSPGSQLDGRRHPRYRHQGACNLTEQFIGVPLLGQ
jgi:hypothetical protein